MTFGALVQAVAVLLAPSAEVSPEVATLSARDKAALVVVSGLPAPRGVAGVIVREWDRTARRPRGALVLVDQEGGATRAWPNLPPFEPPIAMEGRREAFSAGRATGRGLRKEGVHVDLAPALDLRGGPLGSRHFPSPGAALAFGRGLASGGVAACVKHYPGLGSARVSTDESPRVRARLQRRELRAFEAAIRAGAPCVMVSHAFYDPFGRRRASFSRSAYRRLRRTGFKGVAITDSVSVFGSRYAVVSALLAVRAGADLVLFTNGRDAARAIRALVPLARQGVLDERVERVLALRWELGLGDHDGW